MLGVAEGKTRVRSDVTEQQYSLAKPLYFFLSFGHVVQLVGS